jgi:uncharacterized tellurite resistance protein B-like protein
MTASEGWTPAHRLALLYIALAYGTDHDLTDDELETLTQALHDRGVVPDDTAVQEVVLEAAAAFLEGDAQDEVQQSIEQLGETLDAEQRRQALHDVIEIAEADGVLLEREQGLIRRVAEAWSLKHAGAAMIEETSAVVQRQGEDWGLIHELAFIYIAVGHSAHNELSPGKIEAILGRLHEWQPNRSEEQTRDVLRRALQVYADDPEQTLIEDSVESLKEALPPIQRLTVLDDLNVVAQADGGLTDTERELIMNLARAWDLNIRLNGQH